jgi:butyrate kinase
MNVIGILAINPGSTSTKIAVYHSEKPVFEINIKHSIEDLSEFEKITDQFAFRKEVILQTLRDANIDINSINVVVGRGGGVKPIPSGVYTVNEKMKEDLKIGVTGQHVSNLGGLIADDIAKSIPGAKAYIADPIVVDEFENLARYSGHKLFERKSMFHALNQKAVARKHSKIMNKSYEDLNLIVVHLGGGITVGAHKKGLVIDSNQGLDGDGPFSPERSGTLPVGDLVKICFSGEYSLKQVQKMITGEGGLVSYCGTNDAHEVELKAEVGDEVAKEAFMAMAYQIAKEIGAMSTVLCGEVDAILLTGGIARSKWFCNEIMKRVYKLAPVHTYPGEDEMESLAINGLRVATGEVTPKIYS